MATDKIPFNVIVIGKQSVGKTSLIHKYIHGTILEDKDVVCTTNVIPCIKTFRHDRGIDKILFMDTAGQERFLSVTRSFYRNADAAIIMYAVTDRETFDALDFWLYECNLNCRDIPKVIIGNKIDEAIHEVSTTEGRNFAKRKNIELYEMSAKHDIEQVMTDIMNQLIEKATILEPDNNTFKLDNDKHNKTPERSFCCNVQNNIFHVKW